MTGQRRWQIKQRRLGNCVCCGKKAGPTKAHCQRHRLYNNRWQMEKRTLCALLLVALFLTGCATPSVYQCDRPYATAWRFDPDVGRFCRSICDPALGAAESSDFDVYATQLPEYDCWPIVRVWP